MVTVEPDKLKRYMDLMEQCREIMTEIHLQWHNKSLFPSGVNNMTALDLDGPSYFHVTSHASPVHSMTMTMCTLPHADC